MISEAKKKKRKYQNATSRVFWPMFTRPHVATPTTTTGNPQATPYTGPNDTGGAYHPPAPESRQRAMAALKSMFEEINLSPRQQFTYIPLPKPVVKKLEKIQDAITPKGAIKQDIDHITMVYVPKSEEDVPRSSVAKVVAKLKKACKAHPVIKATVQGWAYFDGASKDGKPATALVGLIDAPGLAELHCELKELLKEIGLNPSSLHGFTPHVTFCYLKQGGRVEKLPAIDAAFTIDKVCFAHESVHEMPLGSAKAVVETSGSTVYPSTGGSYAPTSASLNRRNGGPTISGPGFDPDPKDALPGPSFDFAKSPGLGFKSEAGWRIWKAALDIMASNPSLQGAGIMQAAVSRAGINYGQLDPSEARLIEMGIEWYLTDPGSWADRGW